ncbi:MAG TPA: ABC transporter substrate-binding protein [Gaiellaceae bacterium]|nr:ABC transporter substrate-binding protein [Gaiellaceae bacterium]
MSRRIARLLLAAAALALVAGGFAGASGAAAHKQSKKVPKIAKEVPAAIRAKGKLTVASDATYAPMELIAKDGHTVIGVDADLGHAIGSVLGVKFDFENASFDGIIPGLQSGKYDIGMSAFTDTKARQKVVDFVTYFSAGTSFYVKASGGPKITGLASLCGKTVAVENGTTEQTDANAQKAKCKKEGKPGMTVHAFPNQNEANLDISSGHAQVGMADSPVAAYIVKQSNGQFKLAGKSYGTAPYGIALPKHDGMAKPVLAAVKYLMKHGTYEKILHKWGVQSGAISNPKINGATS